MDTPSQFVLFYSSSLSCFAAYLIHWQSKHIQQAQATSLTIEFNINEKQKLHPTDVAYLESNEQYWTNLRDLFASWEIIIGKWCVL
jgi:hypothetical protein